MISKADVERLVGNPVAEGKLNEANRSICEFRIDEMGAAISFMLMSRRPGDSIGKMVAEMNKRQIQTEAIAGLGDGAYRSHAYGIQQAGAFKSSKHLLVTVVIPNVSDAKAQDIAEKALRKAVERL